MEQAAISSTEMPRYRSHKTVWALKIALVVSRGTDATTDENELVDIHFEDERFAPRLLVSLRGKPTPDKGWYLVQYRDSYFSFSPATEFEEGNTLESQLEPAACPANTIGWAVKQMHNGACVRRAGWNGKDMFIFLVPGSQFKVNRPPLNTIFPEGTDINYRPHIDLKGADGSIGTWAPSIHDTLATDWEIAV